VKISKKNQKDGLRIHRRKGSKKTLKRKKNARILFWTSVLLIIIASGILIFVPRAAQESLQGKRSAAVILAIVFWILEMGAYLIQVLMARARKKKQAPKKESAKPDGWKFALEAIIVFGAAALALIGLILSIALGARNGTVIMLSTALFSSTLQIGFLLISKNYIFIVNANTKFFEVPRRKNHAKNKIRI